MLDGRMNIRRDDAFIRRVILLARLSMWRETLVEGLDKSDPDRCDLRGREIYRRILELRIGPKVGYVRSAAMQMLGGCDINSKDE